MLVFLEGIHPPSPQISHPPGLTFADEHRLETLGRLGGTVAEAKCSVTLRVNITFVEASDPGQAVAAWQLFIVGEVWAGLVCCL